MSAAAALSPQQFPAYQAIATDPHGYGYRKYVIPGRNSKQAGHLMARYKARGVVPRNAEVHGEARAT